MKEYSRYSIVTDRSIEMEQTVSNITFKRDNRDPKQTKVAYFIDKIESQLSFMQTEFHRNIHWQRVLLKELKKQRDISDKEGSEKYGLRLSDQEQKCLKIHLKGQLKVDDQSYDLKKMIKMIRNRQKQKNIEKSQIEQENNNRRWSEEVDFPIIPRVITLNDLAPSTQRNLSSSKVTPIKHQQNKMKIPKYHIIKDAKKLFSPESQEMIENTPIKQNSEHSIKYEQYLQIINNGEDLLMNFNPQNQKYQIFQDSLGKRLIIQTQNLVTFRQYINNNDSQKLRQSQNISLCFSKSHQDKISVRNEQKRIQQSDRASVTLSQNQQNHQSLSSLQCKQQKIGLGKAKQAKSKYHEQPFLCFNAAKRRKISKNIGNGHKEIYYKQEALEYRNMKKMHDSFGRVYEEFICQKMPKVYQSKLDDLQRISKQYKKNRQSLQTSFFR